MRHGADLMVRLVLKVLASSKGCPGAFCCNCLKGPGAPPRYRLRAAARKM